MGKVPPGKAAFRPAQRANTSRKSPVGARGTEDGGAATDPAATMPDPVASLLRRLGLDAESGLALYVQVARALEGAARTTKRKSAALGKARGVSRHQPAAALDADLLIPLILGVRDVLKAGSQGSRPSRSKLERLDRAADAALQGLAARGRSSTPEAGRSSKGPRDATELDATHELLNRLVAMTPDAVLTIRASGRIGLWSAAASRLTGRRRWEAQRRGAAALFREKEALAGLLQDLEQRGRVASREVSVVNAAGEDVPVRVYGVRLEGSRDGAGRDGVWRRGGRRRRGEPDPDRTLLLLHDLTEVHHIRRRLIENEKLSAMAKIAGSVAHEFRNPLNSLFLTTDLLEDELEGHEAVRESIAPTLAAVREEIERLNHIITHYLALSRISGAAPEMMDLAATVRSFGDESRTHWPGGDFDLRLRVDDGEQLITADPNQVRRILVNLVENAIDAVRVDDEAEEPRPRRSVVTLQVRRMRRSVKLTVKDNGPGIPEEIQDRVFEPFFTSKAGGSGLGLYLVREIALASGGTMTLSSTVGRGTSVSIRWPFAEAAPEDR